MGALARRARYNLPSFGPGIPESWAKSVQEFSQRRYDGERFVAIFIDGTDYAGKTMICGLGRSDQQGTKRILGLRQGTTENKQVVTSLLEDLAERELNYSRPTLLVLDGAKALSAVFKVLWGSRAGIQRCQIHKKRNVTAHLPEKHWPELRR